MDWILIMKTWKMQKKKILNSRATPLLKLIGTLTHLMLHTEMKNYVTILKEIIEMPLEIGRAIKLTMTIILKDCMYGQGLIILTKKFFFF